MVVGLQGDIDAWNPYTTRDATAAGILDLLYPRLLQETGSGQPGSEFEPWLAESWQFSADRLTVTFSLRRDARWSEGTPVTCDDVRFTYEAQTSEALAWPGIFEKQRIDSVDCPDPHTAVFRFAEAHADQLVDINDDAIVPRSYGDVPLDEWAATPWEERFVSCGPFRLDSVLPGQEAILSRDPDWWGETYLDRVVLRVYPESTGVLARLLDGEVDLLGKVAPLRAAEVAAREDLRLLELPSLSYTFLGWNTLEPDAYLADRRRRGCASDSACAEDEEDIRRLQRSNPHPILADPRIRLALSLAIDREDLVQGLWVGHARAGSSPVVSALWAHDSTSALPYDPNRAARLLDEAGWHERNGDGLRTREGLAFELSVIVNSTNDVRRDALDRVAASLERIGVRLVPEPLPRRAFATRARDKNFDAVLSGWWAGTRIQPQNLLHTRVAVGRGNNLVSWSTTASDALLDRAEAAPTRELALPLWREWQQLFREEQPLTILYEERRLVGMNRRVQGPSPPFLNPYLGLREWWIGTAASD